MQLCISHVHQPTFPYGNTCVYFCQITTGPAMNRNSHCVVPPFHLYSPYHGITMFWSVPVFLQRGSVRYSPLERHRYGVPVTPCASNIMPHYRLPCHSCGPLINTIWRDELGPHNHILISNRWFAGVQRCVHRRLRGGGYSDALFKRLFFPNPFP